MLVGCFDYQDPPQDFVGFVYDSQDGGANWTVSPLPKKVRASESQMIHFDDGAALLLGREMFSTADGGKTWTPVKSIGWDGQFSFVDPLHGWAVATSGGEVALVHTVNGGRTWSEIKPRIAD
jgi:photosystem II stability/assembly factor-like uncharacterized protein